MRRHVGAFFALQPSFLGRGLNCNVTAKQSGFSFARKISLPCNKDMVQFDSITTANEKRILCKHLCPTLDLLQAYDKTATLFPGTAVKPKIRNGCRGGILAARSKRSGNRQDSTKQQRNADESRKKTFRHVNKS